MEVLETRWFEPSNNHKPFAFIDALYTKRKALKLTGDEAHVGIKLALSSLYGKTAQQVGWERDSEGTLRIPPFHQMEWAGFITASCRATILKACLHNLEDVIAFETDAVFSSVPLTNVTVGDELGDFEATVFDDLTYIQSGLYFASSGGRAIDKTRGVDRGTMTRADVLAKLQEPHAVDRVAVCTLTRFIGAGVALAQSWDRWRRWETVAKRMTLEPSGKRVHMYCECMGTARTGSGLTLGMWHTTICPLLSTRHSAQFPVEWINPDPNMTELGDLREEVEEYE
jgi:hypothetical protein